MDMLIRPSQHGPAAVDVKTGGTAPADESANGGVNRAFKSLLAFLLGNTAQEAVSEGEAAGEEYQSNAAEPDPAATDDSKASEHGNGGDVLLFSVMHTMHELVAPPSTAAPRQNDNQIVPPISGDALEQRASAIEPSISLPVLADEEISAGEVTGRTAQATLLDDQPALPQGVPGTHEDVMLPTQLPATNRGRAGADTVAPDGPESPLATGDSLSDDDGTFSAVSQPTNSPASAREPIDSRVSSAPSMQVATPSSIQAPGPITISETGLEEQSTAASADRLMPVEASAEKDGLLAAAQRVVSGGQGSQPAAADMAAGDRLPAPPTGGADQDVPDVNTGLVTQVTQSSSGQRGSMQAFSDNQSRQAEDQRPLELQSDAATAPVRPATDRAVSGLDSLSSLNDTPPAEGDQAVVERVMQRIQTLSQSGQSSVRLRLDPESLGAVDVRLVERQGKIEVQLIAASPEAREVLGSGLQHLRRGLAESGVQVQRIEVHSPLGPPEATTASSGDLLGFASSHGEQDARREHASRRSAVVEHDPASRQSTDEEELVNVSTMPSRHNIDFRA